MISPKVGKGLVLLGNGKAIYFGDLDVQGKLTVNGKEITGNNSGGSDPGTIPPQLTTDAEKRA